MTDVERLLAIEEIKHLKARYFRCMDTKHWDAFEAVFAPDVVFDLRQGIFARDPISGEILRSGDIQVEEGSIGEAWVQVGAANVRAFEERVLTGVITVHHGHMPEIEITSATTARGLWTMEDILRFPLKAANPLVSWLPEGSAFKELHGFGVYHETYERIDGRWLIKTLMLRRLRVDIIG
jgi:SnoaL-like protein